MFCSYLLVYIGLLLILYCRLFWKRLPLFVAVLLRGSAIREVPLEVRPGGSDFSFGHLGVACKGADLSFPFPGESSIAES